MQTGHIYPNELIFMRGRSRQFAKELVDNPSTPMSLKLRIMSELSLDATRGLSFSPTSMSIQLPTMSQLSEVETLGLNFVSTRLFDVSSKKATYTSKPDFAPTKEGEIDHSTFHECTERQHLQIAADNETPAEFLDVLSTREHYRIRQLVARNLNTSPETLSRLSKDSEESVRYCVAENPSTPIAVLVEMSEEPALFGWGNRYWASMMGLLDEIDWASPGNVIEARQLLVHKLFDEADKPSLARAYTLVLGDCVDDELIKCSKSTSWLERCAVAINPNTSEDIIRHLSSDKNVTVRNAADERLKASV